MFKLQLATTQQKVVSYKAEELYQGQLFVTDKDAALTALSVKMAVLMDNEGDVRYINPFKTESLSDDASELNYVRSDDTVYPVTAVVSELKLDTDQ